MGAQKKAVSSHGMLNFLSLIFLNVFCKLGVDVAHFPGVQRKQKHTTFLVVAKGSTLNATQFFFFPFFVQTTYFKPKIKCFNFHGSFEFFGAQPFNKNGLRLKQFARNLRTSALCGNKKCSTSSVSGERYFLQQTWDFSLWIFVG